MACYRNFYISVRRFSRYNISTIPNIQKSKMEKYRSNIVILFLFLLTSCSVSKGVGRDFIDNTANNKGAYGPFTFL